ncbi:hypothetical protein T03_12461 [Trichinella britovi]|uniref:Uncharacterized protein n=1 Tax=Trichinella britovi TaxID=45882 RepID=A0A0V0YSZ8_TRIBR|nr:hypothetical protein T03_12461 [Trichinella britovi]
MDYFTKWTATFPFANMEANTVAKVLVENVGGAGDVPAVRH